jgi:CarD family transcriptional regulator
MQLAVKEYKTENYMNYKVGDVIVHWTHGIGKVVAIDQKEIAGVNHEYYVVDVKQYKLWVPVGSANEGSMRFPMESIQFNTSLDILREPGKLLPDNQYKRKLELSERMQKRSLGDVCHVIRDLTDLSRLHPLNLNDTFVLSQAEEHLLDEWVLSLGTERSNAVNELKVLLKEEPSEPVDG